MIRSLLKLAASLLPLRSIQRDGQPYLDRYYIAGVTPAYFPIHCRKCDEQIGLTERGGTIHTNCPTDHGEHEPVPFPTRLEWLPCLFLHHFRNSDLDAELHNHPWEKAVSLVLAGGYVEERRVKVYDDVGHHDRDEVHTKTFKPGDLNQIDSDDFHRVMLLEHDAWSLFVTGDKTQSWGFWCRTSGEFVPWRQYTEWRHRRRSETNDRQSIYEHTDGLLQKVDDLTRSTGGAS